ncbi:MerR family transcriptional regulator [Svornostia abyssi]|uniref:MerR family transcriptional regulator n=1 Tax=Svornostia abyssi TaxID=2898438 RepID=A0ABY5PHR2_9ACTN|nr:MerR family transcriptional regulator [Parviterribacteraceae bacterium J379]
MPDDLLTIGRFARLTRLSVRQLRRYDEQGLLAPATVDAQTGYRFYHPRQARTAATIALLRELDVPLATIADLLVADEARAAELIAAERARRAAELDRVARALAGLERLGDGALPDPPVMVRAEPERRLAAMRGPATAETAAAVTSELALRLADLLDADVPFTGMFPVDLDGPFDVVLGAEVPPPPGTEPVVLPGGLVASTVHQGPRDTLALAWWPLLAWVHERGLEPAGPVRERYVDDDTTILTVPPEGGTAVTTQAIYPVTMSADPAATAAFYRDLLGLADTFASDWYVSLAAPDGGAQLATVRRDHESIPAGFHAPPAGALVTVEVDDARAIRRRAAAMNVPIELELRDEAWGQRHFICRDPDGLLVDVVELIAPTGEFVAQYVDDAYRPS